MDWAQSGRRDTYRFYAVNPISLEEEREMTAEPSACSINWGYYTDNKSSASIVLVNDTYIDQGRDKLIRVKHLVQLPDGTEDEEVLGTFFVEKPEKTVKDGIARMRLTCYSTMWRLSKDALGDDYVRHAGETIEGGIRGLVEYPGGTLITNGAVSTSRTHTVDVIFVCGENRLETLNTICGWAGWDLDVDDYGNQVLDVYTPPQRRSVAYRFEAGSNCVYLPEYDETYTEEVYNRVIARWSRENLPSEDDPTYSLGYSMRAVADLDPNADYSWERSGRRITKVLDIFDPIPQAELQQKAEEFLASHSAATVYKVIQHVNIPHLRPGMVVEFYEGELGGALCEITQMEMNGLKPLGMTQTKLKVIG